MILDAHQHFWVYTPQRDAWITDDMPRLRRDFLPADLEPVLRQNGIDGCVAVQADQSIQETHFLLQLADQYDFIKGVVGWVELRADDVRDRLQAFFRYPKLKGFRHILQAESVEFMSQPEFVRGVRTLAEFGFTYDLLIYPHQLPAALHLVRSVPEVSFVLDHLSKPRIKKKQLLPWATQLADMAQQPNVHCKLSGLVTEADWQSWNPGDFRPYLDVAFEHFGPERLLFGSDWPVCLLAAEYTQVKRLVEDYLKPLGTEVRQKVFGENAVKFYGLRG